MWVEELAGRPGEQVLSPLTITLEAWPHFKFLSSLQTQKLLHSLQMRGSVVKNLPPKQETWI